MRTVTLLFLVGGLALFPAFARAQNFEEAGKHFSSAQDAFGKQHYKVAAGEFQKAYDLAKDPVLLYNVGEAWEKAGEGHKAVDAYKAYLRAAPKAQDKAEVAKRIKAIQTKRYKLANQSAPGDEVKPVMAEVTPPPPPPLPPPPPPPPPPVTENEKKTITPDFLKEPATPPPPPPEMPVKQAYDTPPATPGTPPPPPPGFIDERPPSRMRIIAWVGVATTVAVLTAGAIFGLAAQSRADEITRREVFIDSSGQPKTFDSQQQADFKNLRDEGHLYNGLAIGFFAAAGVTAVVTTVLFVLDSRRHRSMEPMEKARALNITPVVGKDAAGVSLKWAF